LGDEIPPICTKTSSLFPQMSINYSFIAVGIFVDLFHTYLF
jgi:hypothetical protein